MMKLHGLFARLRRSAPRAAARARTPARAWYRPRLEALEDRGLLTGPIAPIISFSADQSTVSVSYNSYNYTIPRPVVVPWSYTASGTTYWVATTGKDTNPGTSASPFLTINKAVSVAVPGDIVYINSGTYVENLILTTSGTASKPIILSCAPGALGKVTITPSAAFVKNNPDGSVIDVNAADYIWINGLNIEGPMGRPEAPLTEDYSADGITWQGGGGLGDRATNNVVYANVHCGLKEMHHGGTNIDIEGNVIFANGADSLSHGIYMPADNTTMNGNVIFNNGSFGIHSYPSPQNQIITNNVLWGNPSGGIILAGAANQVYHNTVAYSGSGTGSVGIFYFRGGCTNNNVEDNIAVFNDTDAGWDNGGGAYPSPSNNLDDYNDYISVDPHVPLGGHEVRADPKFVNPTLGDFRLQSSSPCLGKGINTASVSGNPSLTLGAYGGPSIALTAPANNAYVAGTITASANASDSSPITSVQFYLDGTALGAPLTQAPYALSIDTTKYAGGAHVLKATATDSQGLAASSSVSITIDNVPPTVAISAPANNAYVGSTITVSANASDNVSVAGVQFYVDGTALGVQVTKAPYSVSLDTTKYSNGTHTLKATATDEVGNTTSTTETVTINNVAVTGPVIVDNGGAGYSETGTWSTETVPAYGGNERYAASSGSGQNTATWQVTGLPAGEYQVQLSWHPYYNQATAAPYAIYDGATLLQTRAVNQTQTASGASYGGVPFQTLATVNIASGTLKVVLSNAADGVFVVADAVRVAPVPVSSTDLNWLAAADGISGPAGAAVQAPFTIGRTYTISSAAAPGNFTIAYYASTSSSTSQDLSKAVFLGAETLSAAADLSVGNHSGASPAFQIASGGNYYLFARLIADPSWAESDSSNDSNDLASTTQPLQVSGPMIVDNGSAGYSETGAWATETVPAYGGSERYAASSGSGQNTATWQVTGLAAGQYQVQVTWHAYYNEASNAPYAIYDGATLLQTVTINQTHAPSGASYGGLAFQTLANVTISSGTLKLTLSNTGNGAFVVADAVRVVPVPASNSDLNWAASGDGITGPTTVTTQATFTINRTYTISGAAAPGNFSIAYYASASASSTQDFSKAILLGTETLSAAADLAVGNHSGVSPAFQIPSGGAYYLFAKLIPDTTWAESNSTNNLTQAAQPLQVSGPIIVDNGAAGYSETGVWNTETVPAYGNSERYATSGGSGQNTATWQVAGLAAGQYQVQVTWHAYYNQATNAPFAIYDGSTLLQTVLVDESHSPSGSSYGGVPFQTLATVNITSGTLKVVLSNLANGVYVVADAIRIAPV